MKAEKRWIGTLLAAALSVGMAVPAMAAAPTKEKALACFEVTDSVTEEMGGQSVDITVDKSFRLGDWNPNLSEEEMYDFGFGDYEFKEYNAYTAIRPDTTFTVKNKSPKGENVFIEVYLQCYIDKVYDFDAAEAEEADYGYLPVNSGSFSFGNDPVITLEEGTYVYLENAGYSLTESGEFSPSYRGDFVQLKPGKSITFDFVDLKSGLVGYDLYDPEGNNMYILTFVVNFADEGYRWSFRYLFHTDEEAIDHFEVPTAELTEDMLTLSNERLLDTGISYDYTVTNTSDMPLKGSYAMIFYTPELNYGYANAEVHIFDLDLAPGQSETGAFQATHFNLVEDFEIMTGKFEDEADKNAFLNDRVLIEDYGRYNVKTDQCAQWLEGLGVTF